MKSPFACCLLALLALPAAGLEPYLVKDINRAPAPDSSTPRAFATFKGTVFFNAEDGVTHADLWRSDGTEAGTWPVLETCQTDCPYNPFPVAVTEDRYFFNSNGGDSLWVTGGDAASTFLLTANPVEPGDAVWARSQRVLYFPAWDAKHGWELWRSDGTPAGTWLVADLRPGRDGSGPRDLVEMGGKVYFIAADVRGSGSALWRTDGTARGTAPVKALANPGNLTALGNRLIFTASRPASGTALWRSDGTAKGTVRIAEIVPGPASAEFRDFAAIGDRLFFAAGRAGALLHLWATDGTPAGTRALALLAGDSSFSSTPPPTVFGDRIFFAGYDPEHGRELWSTDGTARGTRLVRDVCPGSCWGFSLRMLFPHQGRLYFAGLTPDEGSELWATDGTASGTYLVRDLCPGSCYSEPAEAAAVNGRVVFLGRGESFTYQVWSTDGTEAGTVRLSDFEDFPIFFSFSEPVSGVVLFPAVDSGHGAELWRTDGTPEGTRFLEDINTGTLGGSFPELLGAAGGRAFFYADDGDHEDALWMSDGTEAGTALVHELTPGEDRQPSVYSGEPAAEAGGRLVFFRRGEENVTLWSSDGTRAGTQPLAELDDYCCQDFILSTGDKVFLSFDGDYWVSDGTAAGTRKFHEDHSSLVSAAVFQGQLWFTSYLGGVSGRALWRSDGTEAGTLPFGGSLSDVSDLAVHEGRLWFLADDGEHGRELWSTDGTASGTVLERDLLPGPDSLPVQSFAWAGDKLILVVGADGPGRLWVSGAAGAAPRRLTSARFYAFIQLAGQDRIYFAEYDSSALWVSDGTEEGTVPLRDAAGRPLSGIWQLEELGGSLLLSAVRYEGALWESDGTQDGTVRLPVTTWQDMWEPRPLLKAGSRIFFSAFDRDTGWELWAVRP